MLRYLPLLLILPAVAVAQTPEVVTKVEAKLDAERSAQRNEDVEILRRLLNRACGLPNESGLKATTVERTSNLASKLAAARGEGPSTAPITMLQATHLVGPFDGVYLPGAGVVYTLHVPAGVPRTFHGERIGLNSSCSTCHQSMVHASHVASSVSTCTNCHSDVPKSPALLSDWDRTRMDVRGEKPKEPVNKPKDDKPAPAVCEPGNLHSLISGVLAANAKNVRHLGEKEGISVVVTFDEVTTAGKATVWNVEPRAVPEDVEVFSSEPRSKDPWTPPSKPGFTSDEVKALALGDLHLKQGKYKEAADAYAAALARFTEKQFKMTAPPNLAAEQRTKYAEEFQKGVRDAMKSHAKALVQCDQLDAAKKTLDLATEFLVLEVTPTTVPAKSTAPAKLIVTVSKADLDGAKDAAAIKKAVKAERVNFPAEGKK